MSDRRRREPEQKPVASEAAERAIIGACLQDANVFWQSFGKLKPEHFTVPRLGRIWEAMMRCGEANKPINRNWIPLMIKGDAGEVTPISVLLAVLLNDAPPVSEADAYVETVVHLANKRAVLDALEKARSEIMAIDVGVPAENMKDVGIRKISTAFAGDTDDDMMDYAAWGARVARRAVESLEHEDGHAVGLSPGLQAVEEVIGRLLPGKLTVIAGMSSSGKSALVRQIAEAASKEARQRGLGFGYISSLEMTGDEYATRHLAEMVGIPGDRIEQGGLHRAEVAVLVKAAERMKSLPIKVDQRVRMNMEAIRARALKVRNTSGLAFIVIDHLLLIAGARGDSLLDRVSQATIEGKNMAKEFGCPVIMLAQLDEKKILESPSGWPNSSHLFGGQTIMQNADQIMFVHRPEVILAKKEPPEAAKAKKEGDDTPWQKWRDRMDEIQGKAFVFNNKRRGGAGNVKREMIFDGPIMTFRDL